MSHTWMQHPDTGGTAQIADSAVEIFEARGWERMDAPPPEPNPVVAEYRAPGEEPAQSDPKPIEPAAEKPATKSKGASRG